MAYVAMLLFGKMSDEFKNELLVTRLFVLLFCGRDRAHFGKIPYKYHNGSWKRAHSISYAALDYKGGVKHVSHHGEGRSGTTGNLRCSGAGNRAYSLRAQAAETPQRAFEVARREIPNSVRGYRHAVRGDVQK